MSETVRQLFVQWAHVVVPAVGGGVLGGLSLLWLQYRLRRLKRLLGANKSSISRAPDGLVLLQGKVLQDDGAGVAPISGQTAAHYTLSLSAGGTRGQHAHGARLRLSDTTGVLDVPLSGAELMMDRRGHLHEGTDTDLHPAAAARAAEVLGVDRFSNMSVTWREQRIEPGDELWVLGHASSAGKGSRRMSPWRGTLLVADKPPFRDLENRRRRAMWRAVPKVLLWSAAGVALGHLLFPYVLAALP